MTAILDRPVELVDRTGCKGSSTDGSHGDTRAYDRGCRCSDAVAASSLYRRELHAYNRDVRKLEPRKRSTFGRRVRTYAPGLVDAKPAAERLRVLHALGYSWPLVAGRLGFAGWAGAAAVVALADRKEPEIDEGLAGQVATVFAELLELPAPCGSDADFALADAVWRGWGVVDLVAVRRALAGTWPVERLTALEKRAAVYVGLRRGVTESVLGDLLGMSGATITAAKAV